MSAAEEKHQDSGAHPMLPGDPFPWAPLPRAQRLPEEGSEGEHGVTPSPAQSDDLSSFDLGGGD